MSESVGYESKRAEGVLSKKDANTVKGVSKLLDTEERCLLCGTAWAAVQYDVVTELQERCFAIYLH